MRASLTNTRKKLTSSIHRKLTRHKNRRKNETIRRTRPTKKENPRIQKAQHSKKSKGKCFQI